MTFKFTIRNGEQIVQCQISSAALANLAGRGSARDLPTEFEAHRELIETIASNSSTKLQMNKRGLSAFLRNTFGQGQRRRQMPERRHFYRLGGISRQSSIGIFSEDCNSMQGLSLEFMGAILMMPCGISDVNLPSFSQERLGFLNTDRLV